MNPLFVHIAIPGATSPIDFVAQPDVNPNSIQKPKFHQTFIASGKFGRVYLEQYKLAKGSMQYIRVDVREYIDIIYNTDFEYISIVYCNSGSLQFRRGDLPAFLLVQTQIKTILVQRGQSYVLSIKPNELKTCNLVHICIPTTEETKETPNPLNEIKKYFQQFSYFSDDKSIFTSTIDSQKYFLSIREELDKENPDLFLVQAHIDILMLETLRRFEIFRLDENGLDDWDPEIRAVYAMAEMIILGMDESWTIKKFASVQHVNPNKLKILFKNHIGMPAAAFKISVRMQKAAQLLKETKLSIQEISALVGYTNPAQFSTMFKRKLGCTPNQVRKT